MKNIFIIQKSSYNTAVSIPLKCYISHTDTLFCNIFMGHEKTQQEEEFGIADAVIGDVKSNPETLHHQIRNK